MENIISNCPLCEEHSLHLIGEDEAQLMQCIWCGYVSSSKFKGTKEENEEYKKLTEEMQGWAKEALDRIWIPSLFTLPDGMIYPENEDNKMKWRLAELIKIPEKEQKNYPVEGQEGKFYERKFNTEEPKIFDIFVEGLSILNERAKAAQEDLKPGVKLPKLNKA